MTDLAPARPVIHHPRRPHELRDRITHADDTIVLCHFGVARLQSETWVLAVDGLVRHPQRITFDELVNFPKTEITSIHQCCGSPLQPDVATRRVCNVTWGGVRLSEVLENCHPDPAAGFLWARGADVGTLNDEKPHSYVKDVPLSRVKEDILIAYEMNGAPLRPENGYPARLVIPGFYGTNSVKWLVQLILAEARAIGPFTTRLYNDVVRDISGRQIGTLPVWAIAPESIIVSPAPGDRLKTGGPIAVWGWAWADGGVIDVDISTDEGKNWMPAVVEPIVGRGWQKFKLAWHPDRPGPCVLWSRARSADGHCQPVSGARNDIYRVPIQLIGES
ncbi:molybdopterin-dependent oxidoreductase [Dongia sp.]|uniref:molybdopterin-dependent oxidoreductase n=1 Tax=Dongia sp. TaxID=1977262 RepID=UPI0035B3EF3C